MKLVLGYSDEKLSYLTEGVGDKKTLFIEGIFLQADKQNRNNRIYPKSILKSATDKFITEMVKTGRAVGELNHPEGPSINLDKVSHLITEMRWEGNNVIGKAKILETPMGKIARGLIEGGVKLGVSSRGLGTVKENTDHSVVNDDYYLSTVDIVQDPSAPEAFVDGIMEGVEFFYANGKIVQKAAENTKAILKRLSTNQIAEKQARLFQNFLNEVSGKTNF